jgi:hypothetical protein
VLRFPAFGSHAILFVHFYRVKKTVKSGHKGRELLRHPTEDTVDDKDSVANKGKDSQGNTSAFEVYCHFNDAVVLEATTPTLEPVLKSELGNNKVITFLNTSTPVLVLIWLCWKPPRPPRSLLLKVNLTEGNPIPPNINHISGIDTVVLEATRPHLETSS